MFRYEQSLERPEVVSELTKHGLNEMDSPILPMLQEKGNDVFDIPDSHIHEIIPAILKAEITARQSVKRQKAMADAYESRPEVKQRKNVERVRPSFEKLIRGRFKNDFASLEAGVINLLSEVASKHPHFDGGADVASSDDLSGYGELEKILKQFSITNFNPARTLDDIAFEIFYASPYASWMK